MKEYKFIYDDVEYILGNENFKGLINDEEKSIKGISIDDLLKIMRNAHDIEFDVEYYQEACPDCLFGVKEKSKFFPFLEYHFYIFTKDGKFVISDIDTSYKGLSFNKLLKQSKVDDSYIVSFIVCKNCKSYIAQIENCVV